MENNSSLDVCFSSMETQPSPSPSPSPLFTSTSTTITTTATISGSDITSPATDLFGGKHEAYKLFCVLHLPALTDLMLPSKICHLISLVFNCFFIFILFFSEFRTYEKFTDTQSDHECHINFWPYKNGFELF